MEGYHKYVFDLENRKFVGEFEEMYKNEAKAVYDSWHQEDTRRLQWRIDKAILCDYNFSSIVDIGCGKGAYTHQLKKINNTVYGIDISETAVNMARARYPDINFSALDCKDSASLDKYLSELNKKQTIDLIVASQVFSYLGNWRELFSIISKNTQYFLAGLKIPPDPIGFVKSTEEFEKEFDKSFQVIECVVTKKTNYTILFGKSRQS